MTAEVGVPKHGNARLVYDIQALLVTAPLSRGPFMQGDLCKSDPKARADFVTLATSERQLLLLVALEGALARADEVRAVANSVYVVASRCETVPASVSSLSLVHQPI